MLGNWKEFQTDKNADGDYVDSNETEDRTHNAANEIVTLDPDGSGNVAMAHDDNGNRLSFGDTDYTHDAWNRLVRVDDAANGLDYGEYEYYGLHWRSLKRSDTAQAPDGTLDEERVAKRGRPLLGAANEPLCMRPHATALIGSDRSGFF